MLSIGTLRGAFFIGRIVYVPVLRQGGRGVPIVESTADGRGFGAAEPGTARVRHGSGH
jgi:hypothetical protein